MPKKPKRSRKSKKAPNKVHCTFEVSIPPLPDLPESLLTQTISVRLNCPECGELHIDEGEFATKPHHTHACQHCGMVWRPALVNTVGVRFLPGFKN